MGPTFGLRCERTGVTLLPLLCSIAKLIHLASGQVNPSPGSPTQLNTRVPGQQSGMNGPGSPQSFSYDYQVSGNPNGNANQPVSYNYTYEYGPFSNNTAGAGNRNAQGFNSSAEGPFWYTYDYQVSNTSNPNQPVTVNYTYEYGPLGNSGNTAAAGSRNSQNNQAGANSAGTGPFWYNYDYQTSNNSRPNQAQLNNYTYQYGSFGNNAATGRNNQGFYSAGNAPYWNGYDYQTANGSNPNSMQSQSWYNQNFLYGQQKNNNQGQNRPLTPLNYGPSQQRLNGVSTSNNMNGQGTGFMRPNTFSGGFGGNQQNGRRPGDFGNNLNSGRFNAQQASRINPGNVGTGGVMNSGRIDPGPQLGRQNQPAPPNYNRRNNGNGLFNGNIQPQAQITSSIAPVRRPVANIPGTSGQLTNGIGPNSYQQTSRNNGNRLPFADVDKTYPDYDPFSYTDYAGSFDSSYYDPDAANFDYYSESAIERPSVGNGLLDPSWALYTANLERGGNGPYGFQQRYPQRPTEQFPGARTTPAFFGTGSRTWPNVNGAFSSEMLNTNDLSQSNVDYYVNNRNQLILADRTSGSSTTSRRTVASNAAYVTRGMDESVWVVDTSGKIWRLQSGQSLELVPNQPNLRFIQIAARNQDEAFAVTSNGDLYHYVSRQWSLDSTGFKVREVGIGNDGTRMYVDQLQRIFMWNWRVNAWVPYEVNGKGFDLYDVDHVLVYDSDFNVIKRVNGRWVRAAEKCKDVRLMRNNLYYCMTSNDIIRIVSY